MSINITMEGDRKKKAPSVPKFQDAQQHPPLANQKADQLPMQSQDGGQVEKKKANITSINQKLASMMRSKKDLIEKAKAVEPPKPIEVKKIVVEEYDPAFPNYFQECKHLYNFEQDSVPQAGNPEELQRPPAAQSAAQEQHQPQLSEAEEKALKMMQKYGFRVGEGLGKSSQGITTPLTIRKTTDTSCVVAQSSITLDEIIKPQISARLSLERQSIAASPVIVLHGIIDVQSFDRDTETEILAECERYGRIAGHLAYLFGGVLRLFIHYQQVQGAFGAFVHLNDKYYANTRISIRFYNLGDFQGGNFGEGLHPHVSF